MTTRVGTTLVFKEGITKADAAKALESIAHLLDLPKEHVDYEVARHPFDGRAISQRKTRPFQMTDITREFDPEWGFPTFYIP